MLLQIMSRFSFLVYLEKGGRSRVNRESVKAELIADKTEKKSRCLSGLDLWKCSLFVVIIDLRLQILCQSGESALALNLSFVL